MTYTTDYEHDGKTAICETKTIKLAEGITVHYFRNPGVLDPHEVVLVIGSEDGTGAEVEMEYSDKLAQMLDNLDDCTGMELLSALVMQQRKLNEHVEALRQARKVEIPPNWECLTLEREPALEMSLDGLAYRTMATDDDGKRFFVLWLPVENYGELEDVDTHCDWDNPTRVWAV